MAAFSFACFSSGNVAHPPIPFAPPELQSSTPRPAPGHIPAPCPWHRAGRGGAGRGRAPGRAAGGSTGLGGAVPAETVPGWAGPAPLFPPALRPDKMAEGRRLAACVAAGGFVGPSSVRGLPGRAQAVRPWPRFFHYAIKRGAAGAAACALSALKWHRDIWARIRRKRMVPWCAEGLNTDHSYRKPVRRYVHQQRGIAGLKQGADETRLEIRNSSRKNIPRKVTAFGRSHRKKSIGMHLSVGPVGNQDAGFHLSSCCRGFVIRWQEASVFHVTPHATSCSSFAWNKLQFHPVVGFVIVHMQIVQGLLHNTDCSPCFYVPVVLFSS